MNDTNERVTQAVEQLLINTLADKEATSESLKIVEEKVVLARKLQHPEK